MRPKRRYLMLQLDGDCVPEEREFLDAVWHSVGQVYGECGASVAGLALIWYDREVGRAVLRVSLGALGMVRVGLVLLRCVGDCALAVHVVGVSGTLKALRGKFGV